jgi:hypothetical protein
MTIEYETRDTDKSITDAEGVMFAANPVWDRNSRKRRLTSRGGRNAEVATSDPTAQPLREPRSFAQGSDDALASRPIARPAAATYASTYAATPTARAAEADDVSMFAPVDRSAKRSVKARSTGGVAPAAIAAGAVALVALGATGWWMSRDTGGVPEMTPGSTVSEVAAAPLAPAAIPNAPPSQAVNPPPAAEAASSQMAAAEPMRAERRAPAVRTRPAVAVAPSADTAGVNASATLPAGPQPYTALNPDAAPAPSAEPQTLTIPPVQASPIPSTPPTAPTEVPQVADPTPAAPDTTTPPQ